MYYSCWNNHLPISLEPFSLQGKKIEIIVVIYPHPVHGFMPVLVLIPISGCINHGQIRLVLNYHFRIMHTFPVSFNNVNFMDSGFLQHTPLRYCNANMFLIAWSCLPVV